VEHNLTVINEDNGEFNIDGIIKVKQLHQIRGGHCFFMLKTV
jgi:hypothetical protein